MCMCVVPEIKPRVPCRQSQHPTAELHAPVLAWVHPSVSNTIPVVLALTTRVVLLILHFASFCTHLHNMSSAFSARLRSVCMLYTKPLGVCLILDTPEKSAPSPSSAHRAFPGGWVPDAESRGTGSFWAGLPSQISAEAVGELRLRPRRDSWPLGTRHAG